MHYIKEIFKGKESEHAHSKFVRYSKGVFEGAKITIRVSKKNVKLYTSFHLVDEVLEVLGDFLTNKVVNIAGTLSWNKDLTPELEQLGKGSFIFYDDFQTFSDEKGDKHHYTYVYLEWRFTRICNIKT